MLFVMTNVSMCQRKTQDEQFDETLLNDDSGEVKRDVDVEWHCGNESGSRTSEQIPLLQINCGSWKLV